MISRLDKDTINCNEGFQNGDNLRFSNDDFIFRCIESEMAD